MPKNLLIVESPAKAKTIEKILGKDFTVKSSFGHVRDLSKDNMGVDIENNFQPTYVVPKEKQKVVKELKQQMKSAQEIWLATDEDREGEAISWHLCKVLGLDEYKTKRIVFREITKPAIQKAIQNPRTVDINLVNAQQARRVLDRLVGFELSQLLWKKIKGKLSAGRVQSVAVKIIVDRERAIQKFNTEPFYKLTALFTVKNEQGRAVILKAELPHRLETKAAAEAFLNNCKNATYTIQDISVKPTKRRPSAPFTTSTLQQDASRKLGYSVARTMGVAQRLYEAGHISYMRTDSTNLSEVALGELADAIETSYGSEYIQTRRYKSKKENAQEAHEAIRPTYVKNTVVSTDRDQQRLYELIWKRTIASQMSDARLEKTTVNIGISTIVDKKLVAIGEVLKFDGFLKVYLESTDEDDSKEEETILPPLNIGQTLNFKEMTARERFTRPLARFTEASLVKKLEELGIGRPSTYAPTITKIMEKARGYIVKESREGELRNYYVLTLSDNEVTTIQNQETTGAEKNKLFPKDMGMLVSDFLSEHFQKIMTYNFTAEIEKQFDQIAEGNEEWAKMISSFYHPFHKTLVQTLEEAERATGERILGKDPETGKTVLVRMSRFGPVAQKGSPEELAEGEKPQYANLKDNQSLETINFEEALDLFKLPRNLGDFEDKEVVIGAGRYGPYVKFDGKFISIPKEEDPLAISLERSIKLIHERRKADAPVGTYKDLPIAKGKGRFGPFLKWNNMFINIPRKYDPDQLSMEQMSELIEAKVDKEAKRFIQVWEKEGISIQEGRWGPFIKKGKKNYKIPKNAEGKRIIREEALLMTLEECQKIIKETDGK